MPGALKGSSIVVTRSFYARLRVEGFADQTDFSEESLRVLSKHVLSM